MRGALAAPASLLLLAPFVMATWHGKGDGDMPADVKEIYAASDVAKETNVYCFALDAKGKLVHGFQALPKQRDPSHLKDQLVKARGKLTIPDIKPKGSLPDGDGVRLFITAKDRGALPIVEFVPWTKEQIEGLKPADAAREIDPELLRPWLSQLYPPAIRTADQSKPFKTVSGKLSLSAGGVLSGEVKLAKGDDAESAFVGTVELGVRWVDGRPSLRGVIEGNYVYRQRGEQKIPIVAAVESRSSK